MIVIYLFILLINLSAGAYKISNFVLDNGGVKKTSSNYTLYSTIGEPVINKAENSARSKVIVNGFSYISDFTPPKVLSFSPQNKENKVSVSPSIEVVFDENISYSTTPLKVIAIEDNLAQSINKEVSGTITYSTATKKLLFTPLSNLSYNYVYKVEIEIGVVRDYAGNPVTENISWRFRTILSPDKENVIKDEDKKTEIYFPAKAFDEKGFIDISTEPVTVTEDKIEEANYKIDSYQILGSGPEEVRELNFFDENLNLKEKKFTKGVDIVIEYSDSLANQLNNRDVELCYLNEEKNIWVKIKNYEVDKENKKITAKVYHFSFFAVFKKVNYDLSDVYAYPVPWKPNDGDDNTGILTSGITFNSTPDVGTIKIFTISGKLVKKIDIQAGYEPKWDGKNDKGKDVASGVYIYLIENERSKKTGKLMIIR